MCEPRCALQAKDELAQAIMNAIRNHTGRQQHSGLEKAMIQLASARHTPCKLCNPVASHSEPEVASLQYGLAHGLLDIALPRHLKQLLAHAVQNC